MSCEGEDERQQWLGLGSKGDSEPAWVLVSLGERRMCLEVSGIGLRLVARGKGTVEEEVESERVGRNVLHADVDGGVQGVVDMLHVHR